MKAILYLLLFSLAVSLTAHAQRRNTDNKWNSNSLQVDKSQNFKRQNLNHLLKKTNASLAVANKPQTDNSYILQINVPSVASAKTNYDSRTAFDEIRANKININAVRDFSKNFKTVVNNSWRAAQDGGFTSTFVSDGVNTTVVYDPKGHFQYVIRIFEEDKLSSRTRDIVKREYYDASITLVKEVETDTGLITYVHMQDKDTWKIVRVVDGEMQLVQSLNKG